MAVTEKQKIVLQSQHDGVVCGQGFDQCQHRVYRLVERRIRATVNARRFDQDVQLRHQLNPQHGQLLVEDVACL